MHSLGYRSENAVEGCSEQFLVGGLMEARRLSWKALDWVASRIEPGMTEGDALKAANETLQELGAKRFWHRSIIRFGKNTCLPYLTKATSVETLKNNDIFLIDIGPTWELSQFGHVEYEGDVGKTFIVGTLPEEYSHCINLSQTLFDEATSDWGSRNPAGPELYQWLRNGAKKEGFDLLVEADGHRLSDFPHMRFFNKGLTEIEFTPAPNLWVLEVHLVDAQRRFGAFYEDLLVKPGLVPPSPDVTISP